MKWAMALFITDSDLIDGETKFAVGNSMCPKNNNN